MAIVTMADAVAGQVALAAEYNKLIDNIQDLDARLGAVVSANTAHSRLTTLESTTTNTSGNVGIGNQRLSDRLGSGVSNTTNVTTGTATAQLTDIRSRLTAVESGGSVPGAWTPMASYSNSWGSRSGFPILHVRSLPGNNVQIFGTIHRAAGGQAAGTITCTIPVGFRPVGPVAVFAMDSSNYLAAMEIAADGTMTIKVPTTRYTNDTATTYVSGNTISINDTYYVGSGVPNA
jgi:hypothetical protein